MRKHPSRLALAGVLGEQKPGFPVIQSEIPQCALCVSYEKVYIHSYEKV